MTCCINGRNVIRLLLLSAKLLKFEIQKCGQILCAHKPYFLMPGHIYGMCFKIVYFCRRKQSASNVTKVKNAVTTFAVMIQVVQ